MTLEFLTIDAYPVQLAFKQPFQTAQARLTHRDLLILVAKVKVDGELVEGIGEVQSFTTSFYTTETLAFDQQVFQNIIKPLVLTTRFSDITEAVDIMEAVAVDARFLRAGVEMILWDAVGQVTHQSLAEMIGATQPQVPMGIALSIDELTDERIEAAQQLGYRRIKMKVGTQPDARKIRQITRRYPQLQFSVDANKSWTTWSPEALKAVDTWGLRLVEQPFDDQDWERHAWLQANWPNTAVSLDESLNSLAEVQAALQQGSGQAFTLKQGKLGGITRTLQAIEAIQSAGQLAWIGGMLSSNIGRSVDIALASLPGMSDFPGDLSPSARYFKQDVTRLDFVATGSHLTVSQQAGIGVSIDWQAVTSHHTI